MKNYLTFIIGLLVTVGLLGDTRPAVAQEAGQQEEPPTVAVTLWTDKMELFMEHPMLAVNDSGKFIIHLTILDGFQPIREGSVRLEFRNQAGQTKQFTADKLLREGIFTPFVELENAGTYSFDLIYESPQVRDSFSITGFTVYPNAAAIPREDEADAGGDITFLKEQQWKIPFATQWAQAGAVKQSAWAVGKVLPDPQGYVEITAPVEGIIRFTSGGQTMVAGASVKKGQSLVTIMPSVGGEGWTARQLEFEQTKRDYERAQRLKDRDAISQREFERFENDYLARKSGIESFSGSGTDKGLNLTAQISGQITEWQIAPGQMVSAGQKLGAIADAGSVLLQANVNEGDFTELGTPTGAYVRLGSGRGQAIAPEKLRVLSMGSVVDPITRTVPIVLRIENPSKELKVNQSLSVELYSTTADSAIMVPESAVYIDEGIDVVYVQAEGEAFAKRAVRRGPRYSGMVAILEGIQAGDRIVTTGGYHVKLASTSAQIGHGHAH